MTSLVNEMLNFQMPTQCFKNGTVCFYIAVMHPKDVDGMANSVDPDQTAPVGAG